MSLSPGNEHGSWYFPLQSGPKCKQSMDFLHCADDQLFSLRVCGCTVRGEREGGVWVWCDSSGGKEGKGVWKKERVCMESVTVFTVLGDGGREPTRRGDEVYIR